MNLIWKNWQDFRNHTIHRKIDVDGFPKEQPYQCWDLSAYFWQKIVGRWLATKKGGGGAKDCWNYNRDYNAGTEFELITNRHDLKEGDWLIDNGGQWGHVGMITGIIIKGQVVRLLGQNQPYGYVNEIPFSLTNFAGAFRLKAWATSAGDSSPKEQKTTEELAKEVISGKHGNGEDRKRALGDRYAEVQSKVNEMLSSSKPETPAPASSPQRESHIVQHGETLGQIIVSRGWANGRPLWGAGGAVEQIARHNGIANANIISIGQKIERDY